ncbi:hypothetical protein L226DRAFT_615001 [Lentinus tigrinus ALCF2SS1-7]|uniref:Uncharacterized protein n=1 Tax=Lentinus tigrinus ALCF2SS1-6 TaxID=1328759 RepID=A0A5C2S350_9APHY|nr:hypothetical protein L227DRAFT_602116 [Lentinus tigrinus ALCF2SS1-6]RPD72297.1 hypothetical protein L226DRAFT_615001 [Lentinus tigrinus ALCF2SS1-7]
MSKAAPCIDRSLTDSTVLASACKILLPKLSEFILPELEKQAGKKALLDALATLCALQEGCDRVALALSMGPDGPELLVSSATPISSTVQAALSTWSNLLRVVVKESDPLMGPKIPDSSSSTVEETSTALTEAQKALILSLYQSSLTKFRAHFAWNELDEFRYCSDESDAEDAEDDSDDEDNEDDLKGGLNTLRDKQTKLGNGSVAVDNPHFERLRMPLHSYLESFTPIFDKSSLLNSDDILRMHWAGKYVCEILEDEKLRDCFVFQLGLIPRDLDKLCMLYIITTNLISAALSEEIQPMLLSYSGISVRIIERPEPRAFVADASKESVDRMLPCRGSHWTTDICNSIPEKVPLMSTMKFSWDQKNSYTYNCVVPHCEALLLSSIVQEGLSVYPYIATSQDPCFFCRQYFVAVNAYLSKDDECALRFIPIYSSTEGPLVLPWVMPEGPGNTEHQLRVQNVFLTTLKAHLFDCLSV